MKIRIGIVGYGNLGRGVECAVTKSPDMTLVGIFTRRNPESIHPVTETPVYHVDQAQTMRSEIDVMILCGGSANDLAEQTPAFAHDFNVVDSFDTHAKIPEHFAQVDEVCKASGKIGVISVGWDPGLFSLNRLYGQAVLPNGKDDTFWGKGVSQGHSDAVRRIPGVRDAKQYTIPVEAAMEQVKRGEAPTLSAREKHTRECFVVAEAGADLAAIETAIRTMPNYFADYDTTVHFVSQEELDQHHAGYPHGGVVFRTGVTGLTKEHRHVMEYRLTLESNPEFTAGVLTAYARAAYRMNQAGQCGCKTAFDVAPADLHPTSGEELRRTLL